MSFLSLFGPDEPREDPRGSLDAYVEVEIDAQTRLFDESRTGRVEVDYESSSRWLEETRGDFFFLIRFRSEPLRARVGETSFLHLGVADELILLRDAGEKQRQERICTGLAGVEQGDGPQSEFEGEVEALSPPPVGRSGGEPELSVLSVSGHALDGTFTGRRLGVFLLDAEIFERNGGQEIPLDPGQLEGRRVRIQHTAKVMRDHLGPKAVAVRIEAL